LRLQAEQFSLNNQLQPIWVDPLSMTKKSETALEHIRQSIVRSGLDGEALKAALASYPKTAPKTLPQAPGAQRTVSLCMITKNEEANLARCLLSAEGVVDEIIVVDTGSTDCTREIAEAFGAQVEGYVWTEDFAAARNVSLAKASGDWILVLDADEVLSPRDHPELRRLISEPDSGSVAYRFTTRNYTGNLNLVGWIPNDGTYSEEEAGHGWVASPKVRLFPNDPGIRFEYPIHEVVEPSLERNKLLVKASCIPIHHYGGLVQETTEAKRMIYYQLGKRKLSQLHGNAAAMRELGIQAGIVGNHQEAVDLWERYIITHPNDCIAYVHLGASFAQLGAFEKASEMSQKALQLDPASIEALYNYGISQFYLGNYTLSIEAFQKILKLQPNYLPAAFMLGASYCCNSMPEEGIQTLDPLRKTAIAPHLSARCLDLTRGLLMRHMLDSSILLLEGAIASQVVSDEVMALLPGIRAIKNNAT
jgi:glycosyltransferase involved in cell wall biosynthesis